MARRATRAAIALALSAAAVFLFVRASGARDRAIADAADRSRLIAQAKLAPLFTDADLSSPITGDRYAEIASEVRQGLLDKHGITAVTLWSEVGRILFAKDPNMVGTRPTYIRNFVYAVANGTTQTKVEAGSLKTFAPIWRQPGGTVAVAELDQPLGPIAGSAGRTLTLAALVCGLAGLASWVLFAMTWRSGGGAVPRPTPLYAVGRPGAGVGMARPMAARSTPAGPMMGGVPLPQRSEPAPTPSPAARTAAANGAAAAPAVREAEQARDDAVERARAAEARLKKVQLQHRQAIERLEALEARLSVAAAAPKQAQEELRALRDQVRESAERLHSAERENEQLRARLGGAPHLPGAVGAGGNVR
jgi:hypothetical protein